MERGARERGASGRGARGRGARGRGAKGKGAKGEECNWGGVQWGRGARGVKGCVRRCKFLFQIFIHSPVVKQRCVDEKLSENVGSKYN
jgi:hypothetical protein